MLTDQPGNSDTSSQQLLVDSQLLGLGFAGGNGWSRMIQEDCLKMLESPVQDSKKSHLPSKFTLFGAWFLLLLTIGVMLAPISNVWSQEPDDHQIRPEERALTNPQ
ncbi:MAG TPA: hypothetical protein V6D27_17260 [Vampirovibrionales bacterium]